MTRFGVDRDSYVMDPGCNPYAGVSHAMVSEVVGDNDALIDWVTDLQEGYNACLSYKGVSDSIDNRITHRADELDYEANPEPADNKAVIPAEDFIALNPWYFISSGSGVVSVPISVNGAPITSNMGIYLQEKVTCTFGEGNGTSSTTISFTGSAIGMSSSTAQNYGIMMSPEWIGGNIDLRNFLYNGEKPNRLKSIRYDGISARTSVAGNQAFGGFSIGSSSLNMKFKRGGNTFTMGNISRGSNETVPQNLLTSQMALDSFDVDTPGANIEIPLYGSAVTGNALTINTPYYAIDVDYRVRNISLSATNYNITFNYGGNSIFFVRNETPSGEWKHKMLYLPYTNKDDSLTWITSATTPSISFATILHPMVMPAPPISYYGGRTITIDDDFGSGVSPTPSYSSTTVQFNIQVRNNSNGLANTIDVSTILTKDGNVIGTTSPYTAVFTTGPDYRDFTNTGLECVVYSNADCNISFESIIMGSQGGGFALAIRRNSNGEIIANNGPSFDETQTISCNLKNFINDYTQSTQVFTLVITWTGGQ